MKTDRSTDAKSLQAEFGHRFRIQMERKGIKQKDLAAKIEVEAQQVNKWCTRGVPAHYAIPVAELIFIEPEQISPKFAKGLKSTTAQKTVEYPSHLPSVAGDVCERPFSEHKPTPKIPERVISMLCAQLPKAQWFIARDRSMAEYIEAGDLVIIDTEANQLEDNAVFAFSIKGQELFTRRTVYQPQPGRWILVCDNSDKTRYPDTYYSPDDKGIELVGKVFFRGG